MSAPDRLYTALVTRVDRADSTLPEAVQQDVPRNGLQLVAANTLQSSGDQTVSASTVLPWVFHVLGVPAALVGLLVPIRESGSMLPQAFLTPLVVRVRRRKWVFVTGAAVQAVAVAVMVAIAALGHGTAAGVGILAALAVFSLGRCLCSIASKEVQGRTIPSGERGQIIGLATSAAGLVAITLGPAIRLMGGENLDAAGLAVTPGGRRTTARTALLVLRWVPRLLCIWRPPTRSGTRASWRSRATTRPPMSWATSRSVVRWKVAAGIPPTCGPAGQ